jgi:hypothetical protein
VHDERIARPAGQFDHPQVDTGFVPAFDVADYVAWRADNPR